MIYITKDGLSTKREARKSDKKINHAILVYKREKNKKELKQMVL